MEAPAACARSYSILRVDMLFERVLICDVCRLFVCVCVAMRHHVPEPLVWNMLDGGFSASAQDKNLARKTYPTKKSRPRRGSNPRPID